MHRKSESLLSDIQTFCEYIVEFTKDSTFEQYMQHPMLRHAVERNFQTLGEAMIRLQRVEPRLAESFESSGAIIGLRHRLAHGYLEDIDDVIIWEAATIHIPSVLRQIELLLPSDKH
ncbi:MAG TPA: DUF86 domain-containing protein [Thermomicrobiales bacterium]|nr:DUF86 domain-containing protein [Thermomicrobiales bacterium]